ncbi:MAG: co-chaperone DjlA [Deferrisomatales bacterium]
MGLSGKLIGAGLGWFLGGPLGAVLGGVIGHYVKDAPLQAEEFGLSRDPGVRQQQEEVYFVASLVGILTAMMQADGEIRREEVQTIRRFFSDRLGYRGESLDIVRDLIKEFLKKGVDLDRLCADVAHKAPYEIRLLLIQCLHDVALADGRFHPAEKAVFERVARLLGLAPRDLLGALGGGNGHRDYEVLGLSPSASADEVRAAYRELAKKYHPDRVAHLGEEFRQLAHEKFIQVQEAYDRIRETRKI